MSAVLGLDVGNIVIGEERLARLRQKTNERIVDGMDDQRGSRDPVDHIGGCGPGVVVIGTGESAIVGSYAVVKLAQRLDSAQARGVEGLRKQPHLAAKPLVQLQQKIVLINPVGRLMQRVGPSRQIDRGTNRRHSAELRRTFAAPLPRQLQNQIAAHGKTDEHETGNSVALNQVARHRRDVLGAA